VDKKLVTFIGAWLTSKHDESMNYSDDAVLIRGKLNGHRWAVAQVVVGVALMLVGALLDMSTGWFAVVVFIVGATTVVGSILMLAIRYGDRKALLIISSIELLDVRQTSSQEFFEWTDIFNVRQQYDDTTSEVVGLIIEMKSADATSGDYKENSTNDFEVHTVDLRGLEIDPVVAAELIESQFQKQRVVIEYESNA